MTTALPEDVVAPETADALLVLERMDEGFYAIDREWRFRYVNRTAESFWGISRKDLLGQTMQSIFPRFEGSPAHQAHVAALQADAPSKVETVSTATGAPVRLRLFPTGQGLSVYFLDITERRKLEQELRTRDELLTLAEQSAGIGVWVADLESGTVTATPQFYHLLGTEPVTGPVPQDLPRSFRHPDDRQRVVASFHEAMAAGAHTHEAEYRIIRPSGEMRWIFGRGRVARDNAGRPRLYSGIDIDITERKKQEEHISVVMRELLHRTNNLLAVVQSMARRTARGSAGLKDFIPAFGSRLQGLAESSSLLARQDWRGAHLDELVAGQVHPFAEPQRVDIAGPPVLLTPKAVQNLGLAFHELCTNAVKYGALSLSGGRVRVRWAVEGTGPAIRLRIEWKELDGPRVSPPKRAGFGRVVSEQMLTAALDAEVTTSFAEDGLHWVAKLPEPEFTIRA